MINSFDRHDIAIISSCDNDKQTRDIKAVLLTSGYSVTTVGNNMIVVNTKDDVKFTDKCCEIANHFNQETIVVKFNEDKMEFIGSHIAKIFQSMDSYNTWEKQNIQGVAFRAKEKLHEA